MQKYAFPLLLLVAFAAAMTMSAPAMAGGQNCATISKAACGLCPDNAKATATTVGAKQAGACLPGCCKGQPGSCATTAKATGAATTSVKATAVKTSATACDVASQCNGKVCGPCKPGDTCDGKPCGPCDPEDCRRSCEMGTAPTKIAL